MSSRRLVWAEHAITDLEAIERYIAADDPVVAARWIDRLLAAAARVARVPMSGRIVPEVGRVDIRETRVRTYRIVYRATKGRVEVLTVFEGHRRFPTGAVRAKRRR